MSKLEKLIQKYCPDGVQWKSLGDVCQKVFAGGTPTSSNDSYYGGDIPWLRSGEVNFNEIKTTEKTITEEGYNSSSAKWIEKHSVLIAMTGATVARSAMTMIDLTANQSVCALTPKRDTLYYRYLYYWISKSYLELKGMAQGALTSLNLNIIKALEIPIPPLPIQEEIVRVLDKFAELQVDLQTELKKRQQQFNYYRDQLLAGDESFQQCKLIDLLSRPITDGPHTTPQFFQTGVPFVSVEAVWDGRIHFEKKRGYISPDFDKECSKKYKPKRDDVFMVKSGSTTGKVAYVDTDESFNIWSPLAAMRVNEKTSSRYLFHLLQTSQVQEQVVSKSSQGSQPNLSMRVLEQFDVAVPSLPRQLEIVSLLDRFDTLTNDLVAGLPAEIEKRRQQYEYYRDKLLTFKRKEA